MTVYLDYQNVRHGYGGSQMIYELKFMKPCTVVIPS